MYLESQSGTARLDKFTHSLLVKSNVEVSPFLLKGEEPPVRIGCDELLTIEHILLTCSDLIEIREPLYRCRPLGICCIWVLVIPVFFSIS